MPTLTTMNYDLITKLAKLANNNPNENEANLAARKVCRLLAEGEFQFNQTGQTNQATQQQPNRPPPYSRPSYQGFDFGSIYEEFFANRYRRRESYDYETAKEGSWKSSWFDEEIPKKETIHTYQCKKCGHHKTTEFRGPASEFMCMDCRGKENFEKKDKDFELSSKPCTICGREYMTRMKHFVCNQCYQAGKRGDL